MLALSWSLLNFSFFTAPRIISTMSGLKHRKLFLSVWTWAILITVILFLYPIENRYTRLGFSLSLILTWFCPLALWWHLKKIRTTLIILTLVFLLPLTLPGRKVEPAALAKDYVTGLKLYRHTRYVWGGEGLLGIDCSGLIRKGLFWGQILHGIKTINGTCFRSALELWLHDASAMALMDGYRNWTQKLFSAKSIMEADHSQLRTGDLAVTQDGMHILAYMGNSRWIEADPNLHQVTEVTLPTDNPWFHKRVVLLRWIWME